MLTGAWLIPLFPLLGFLYSALVGRTVSHRSCGLVGSAVVGLSFLTGLGVLFDLLALPEKSRAVDLVLYTWIGAGDLAVPFSILVDPLSVLMVLVVTGVGFLIHVYATGYMHGDPGYGRFFAYMNLFVLSMLMLVLAGNFVLLIVGWGGVGFSSYALISFWFHDPKNAAAGTKALVMNTIGDVGLILAAILVFLNFGRVDYSGVFEHASDKLPFNGPLVTAIALLLLLGAAAKSAQLPLHTWLPDAMAGPTPVSALIHAATMVTAGVYLVSRMHPIFLLSPTAMAVVATIGAVGAVFAATIGLVQPNLKRVLAYSTVSQLGYMFLAVGVGAFTAGMFHLVTHAFFKATLFLAAGGVIHALGGEEDLRRMGGLRRVVPVMYWGFLIGALANVGFPLTSGFFSKDKILFGAFASERGSALLGGLALLSVVFTGFYVFRAFFMAFHGESRAEHGGHQHGHLPGASMSIPVALLAVLAALGGYLQFVAGPGSFERFLEPVFHHYAKPVELAHDAVLQQSLMASSVTLGLLGIAAAFVMYVRDPRLPARLGGAVSWLYRLLLNKYYVDEIYDLLFVRSLRAIGGFLSGAFEPAATDGVVKGVTGTIRGASLVLRRAQTGFLRDYAVAILAGAVVIVAYVLQAGAA